MAERTEAAIGRWHEVVNAGDLAAARGVVADQVVVNGPKGAGVITAEGFAEWIARSGIRLRPRAWHPVGDRVMVVEQDARWPGDEAWSQVATVFRVTGDRVSTALRFSDLRAALDFASIHPGLAETEGGPDAEGAGQALFRFVRHWSRRRHGPDDGERGREVLVTEAVCALQERGEVTVNDVAAELGIDQSGASRMLAHAAGRGLLAMTPSETDARRRTVTLTDAGHDFLAAAHRWQDETFATLTAGWTPAERTGFQQAMTRLITASAALTHGSPGTGPR
ncbi:MarR family transcriptional regulator [Spongiactinospora sp. 9N601]|uniref:MarR family transcriptional regulator n=1 Tax=Spongiactinospora sp. 9N601 TaxID=3375149 RepID=UPI00378E6298